MNDLIGPSDLTAPLGVKERPARRRLRVPVRMILGSAVAAILLLFAGWIAVVRDPLGGEPTAVAIIDMMPPATVPDAPRGPAPAAKPGVAEVPGGVPNQSPAGAVEQASGVTVVRGGGGGAPQSIMVQVPDAPPATMALAPPDPALTERSRQGPLPKTGADGRRPADVYARPVVVPPGLKPDAPRIAILVGGMGISQNGTSDAIARLPPGVTLAFAPYGTDLDRVVQRARADGHEVMLQAPMEPFDYPDSDPGPRTLLTSAKPDDNLDSLRWQMSRFSGYVGVTNYLGGKFTASADAFTPMLKEIAGRGLIYADDGSSPRSLAGSAGKPLGLTVPKADMTIDATPTPAAIDGALAKLEQLARDKGSAFAVASGLPVTVGHVADWSKGLEKRGILMVPVSALAR